MKIQGILPGLALAALGVTGCGGGGSSDGGSAPLPVPPPKGEQWTLVQPTDVGMDASLLARAVSDLPAPSDHKLASMLVLRHGKPVLEQYWNGYDKDTAHDLRSATKSITSLLIGIALDTQALSSVRAPIANYLNADYPNAPALKQGITIEHLLTMSSGLACNDWDAFSPGNEQKMYPQTDWVQFILNLPSSASPGTVTQYCTGGPVTLGHILANATKQSIPAFASAQLPRPPIGATSPKLEIAAAMVTFGG